MATSTAWCAGIHACQGCSATGLTFAPVSSGGDLQRGSRRWKTQSMETEPGSLSLQLVDRLGKLEGLIIGLQTSIGQSQAQTTAFMGRVERLEARQVELERNMITKQDISQLVEKVDQLTTSEARQQGGTAVASWSAQAIGTWAAVIIALLALVGVGVQRERLNHQTPAGRSASP